MQCLGNTYTKKIICISVSCGVELPDKTKIKDA